MPGERLQARERRGVPHRELVVRAAGEEQPAVAAHALRPGLGRPAGEGVRNVVKGPSSFSGSRVQFQGMFRDGHLPTGAVA